MLATRGTTPATYEDIKALPEGVTGQIIDGVLYTHTRPASPHLVVASRLGSMLMPPFDRGLGGPGGWVILDEPELHVGRRPDILVPDLAGWRRERMPVVESAPWFGLVPDWACEVLSPGTARIDRMLKLPIYARERVEFVWIVDPVERSIEVFRLEDGRWSLVSVVGEGDPIGVAPFEAVPLDLAYLWGR